MTITTNDIVLYQAQDNTDNDSGGGSRTAIEVVSGDVNNLFPDISRVDTVSGRVNLRKVFPTVTTDNNDVYYGAHSMIRNVPTDPNVSALLFHTDDPHDSRLDAQDKIENYVVASFAESFYLFGNHVEGSKSVTFLQLLTAKEPDTGEVYLLKEGVNEQYIRISSVEVTERTFIYYSQDVPAEFVRRQIICTIDQPLDFAFAGSAFQPTGQEPDTADTWATQVADASKFYSTKTLALDAIVDDTTIKVDSIFTQLVPAAKKKTFLTNKTALLQGTGMIGSGLVQTSPLITSSNGADSYVGSSVMPNSMTFFYTSDYGDDGNGNIVHKTNGNSVGKIDYATGIINQYLYNGTTNITFEPALAFSSTVQFTGEIKITQENVGNTFISPLSPAPSVGDLYVDYRSNGKWYRIASTGSRTIDGTEVIGTDPQIGGGNLYVDIDGTATLNLTFGAIADIDSAVVISWGSSEHLTNRSAYISDNTTFEFVIDLEKTNIDPLSFNCTAYSPAHGIYYNLTSDADGNISDDASSTYWLHGHLDFVNGLLIMTGANEYRRMSKNTNVTATFNYAEPAEEEVGFIKTVVASRTATVDQIQFGAEDKIGGSLIVDLGENVDIGSIAISMVMGRLSPYRVSNSATNVVSLRSNVAGQLIVSGTGQSFGSVSAAGVITFNFPSKDYSVRNYSIGYLGNALPTYTTETARMYVFPSDYNNNDEMTIKYRTGAGTVGIIPHTVTGVSQDVGVVRIQTLENISGEVTFESPEGRNRIYHSKKGLIYNSSNVQVGVIDYKNGRIEHLYEGFDDEIVNKVNFTKLFTDESMDNKVVSQFSFRTASTKLTTSSFSMSYESANGSYSATADAEGVITGTDIDSGTSYVDTQTGMAHLEFTAPVIADTIKYNAVAETSLPLDPELLGLNPVRLPADGRVPVFKAGYLVVIFNEVETAVAGGGTPVADQVQVLARSGQAMIEVVDVNDRQLNPAEYVVDRVAGSITFGNPLNLTDKHGTALVAPYRIVDRIEDMVMANDVQINGLIGLSAPLTHAYTNGITKVSSSLVFGDTGSRVYSLFTQKIWSAGSPVWSDELIGDTTTAKYDLVNYPIAINNADSSAGRWAIIFNSSNSVDVVNEKLGVVLDNLSIAIDDVAPLNPATGLPYFTMPKGGFGAGWVANNVIRFNTDSGDNNMWVIRTIQAGALSEITDSIDLEIRGDAN